MRSSVVRSEPAAAPQSRKRTALRAWLAMATFDVSAPLLQPSDNDLRCDGNRELPEIFPALNAIPCVCVRPCDDHERSNCENVVVEAASDFSALRDQIVKVQRAGSILVDRDVQPGCHDMRLLRALGNALVAA